MKIRPTHTWDWRTLALTLLASAVPYLPATGIARADTHSATGSDTGRTAEGRFALAPAVLAEPLTMHGDIRGQLRPVRHTILAAGMSGKIDAFPVRLGSHVAAGEVLVDMACAEVNATLAAAQARISAAQARHSVNRQLSAANNISGLEMDLSRAELAMAVAERDRVEAQRSHCRITAPFAGVVVDKRAQAHQHVAAGEPLLELVDNSLLEVEVAVPSYWLDQVSPGTGFEIVLDETGQAVRGTFERTSGRIDSVSQTLRVVGSLVDPPAGTLAGMSGRLRILSDD